MGLGIAPFLLFVGFVVFRVIKEAAKVEQGRPRSDGSLPESQNGTDGARDISDFLEELKRMHSPAPPLETSYDETRELRRRVRDASRRNREMKTRVFETPPPTVQTVAPVSVQTMSEGDLHSVSADSAYSEKTVVRIEGGLAHPVFSRAPSEQMTIAKRAIVLREVLGPPVGLR